MAEQSTGRREGGSAIVDFVLVMLILIPLVLGIIQVALVLHVRNVTTSAASEGARAAAVLDAPLAAGVDRTRQQIRAGIADRFAEHVTARPTAVAGAPGVEVVVTSQVPALGLFGPAVTVTVRGHAISEVEP